jgi:hypothetical protein
MRMFGLYLFILQSIVFFALVSVTAWRLCTPRMRPLAIAVCSVSLAPISYGSYYWPLISYVLFREFWALKTPSTLVLPIVTTAAVTFTAVHIVLWLTRSLRKRPHQHPCGELLQIEDALIIESSSFPSVTRLLKSFALSHRLIQNVRAQCGPTTMYF